MGIIKLGRKVRQARNFVKSGSDFVAPHVDQLQEQVNLWAPRVTDAATQVKQLIVEEAPVKAGIAKEKAASIVENSKTLEGAREDALLLKEQLAARAAEVANEASTRVSEAAALTADHVDQASKVAAETSEKASKHASKRAHKRADKVAKRAAKAAAKADRHAGKAQKPHRGLKFFLVVGPLLAIGAAAGAVASVPVSNQLLAAQVEQQQSQQASQNEQFGRDMQAPGGQDGESGSSGESASGSTGSGSAESGSSNGSASGGSSSGSSVDAQGQPGGDAPGGMMGGFNRAVSYVSSVNATVNLKVVGQLLLIGLGLTLAAALVAVIFVMRYEPLQILADRS